MQNRQYWWKRYLWEADHIGLSLASEEGWEDFFREKGWPEMSEMAEKYFKSLLYSALGL